MTFRLRSLNMGNCEEPGGACGMICVRSTSRILPSALRVKASRTSAVSMLSLYSSLCCAMLCAALSFVASGHDLAVVLPLRLVAQIGVFDGFARRQQFD